MQQHPGEQHPDEHHIATIGPLPQLTAPAAAMVGDRRRVYESDWMTLDLHQVETVGGTHYEHHVVGVPYRSVGVVVQHSEWGVLCNLRHRFTTGTTGFEIPGGGVDAGETLSDAGRREVLEETGWAISEPQLLIDASTSDGNSSARFTILHARAIQRESAPTDLDELAPVYWLPPGRIVEVIRAGLVPCAFSLTALTTALLYGIISDHGPVHEPGASVADFS